MRWAQAGFVPLHVGLYAWRSRAEGVPRLTTPVAQAPHLAEDLATVGYCCQRLVLLLFVPGNQKQQIFELSKVTN